MRAASLPPLASNRRPLSEYGTAQRLLRLFTPAPGEELQASDWEQGPSAMEELRKADPALLTPIRPLGGIGLGIGRTAPAIAPEALEAIGEATEATPETPPTAEKRAVARRFSAAQKRRRATANRMFPQAPSAATARQLVRHGFPGQRERTVEDISHRRNHGCTRKPSPNSVFDIRSGSGAGYRPPEY